MRLTLLLAFVCTALLGAMAQAQSAPGPTAISNDFTHNVEIEDIPVTNALAESTAEAARTCGRVQVQKPRREPLAAWYHMEGDNACHILEKEKKIDFYWVDQGCTCLMFNAPGCDSKNLASWTGWITGKASGVLKDRNSRWYLCGPNSGQ